VPEPGMRAPGHAQNPDQHTSIPSSNRFKLRHLRKSPENTHHRSDFQQIPRPEAPFPWEQLDGRPLVYASLGTLQNGLSAVFRIIAEACAPLGVQLVLGLGNGLLLEDLRDLPGNTLDCKGTACGLWFIRSRACVFAPQSTVRFPHFTHHPLGWLFQPVVILIPSRIDA
jgi:hypothetical protein